MLFTARIFFNGGLMKKLLFFSILLISSFFISSCGGGDKDQDKSQDEAAYSPSKDSDIQQYNLEQKRKQTQNRTPCDTIALAEFILQNFPAGSYLVEFDRTYTYNVPKAAVIYFNRDGNNYVLAVVAKSKPGERLIELKNVIGYDASFIDYDSTKLGTSFFYLDLFRCNNETFELVWDEAIPSHGGFNWIALDNWKDKNIPYAKINFHYGSGIGHIEYNYFFIYGFNVRPHLLMTYEGINFKRTIGNVNGDRYPDYYEWVYYDLGNRVYSNDTIPFVWSVKDSLYVNKRNKKQTRPY
jgi:hypothetical protein